jgi:hypothetical protein
LFTLKKILTFSYPFSDEKNNILISKNHHFPMKKTTFSYVKNVTFLCKMSILAPFDAVSGAETASNHITPAEAAEALLWGQKTAENDPKTAENDSKMAEIDHKTTENDPKTPQNGSKLPQNPPKTPQNASKTPSEVLPMAWAALIRMARDPTFAASVVEIVKKNS